MILNDDDEYKKSSYVAHIRSFECTLLSKPLGT